MRVFDFLVNRPGLKRLYERGVTILGDLKIFPHPFFLVYDPGAYKVRGNDLRKIQGVLEPGDILLRYYDHYLDSMFIPGKFSHAALYVGHQRVVHAVAEGVVDHDILDFCRCDGVVALRPRKSDPAVADRACRYARAQIGKGYDFFFNFTSEDTFCCSELVFWAYKNELPLHPREVTRMGGLLRGYVIPPQDFLDCPALEVVFETTESQRLGLVRRIPAEA